MWCMRSSIKFNNVAQYMYAKSIWKCETLKGIWLKWRDKSYVFKKFNLKMIYLSMLSKLWNFKTKVHMICEVVESETQDRFESDFLMMKNYNQRFNQV